MFFFVFKQKTAYEMRISDWSSDVCSSDLDRHQMAFTQALLEGVVQFAPGQRALAVVQVVIHHLFVDFDHLIDDLLVRCRNIGAVTMAIRLEETVDYRTAIARRQVDRQALRPEADRKSVV